MSQSSVYDDVKAIRDTRKKSEKDKQTLNLTEMLSTNLQEANKEEPVYDKAAVLTAVANLAYATADAVSAAKADTARARSVSSSSLDCHHSVESTVDAIAENEDDIVKERSKTIESTYYAPRSKSDGVSSTMVNRKLPQIPKDRSISVAVPSRIRNTISNPLEIESGYRSRHRNEESIDLHNRKLPKIPHTTENVYRSNSGSSTLTSVSSSQSTSDIRSFQEVKPKSFSNRELPEIPKDAEVNAAKILKSVQGQHSHGGSPMLESTTDSGQVLDPSRQGPLPPVLSRGNDCRESQFIDRPYVRLDSFSDSNSDSEYQSSHDQSRANKESNYNLQPQVDSAEESKDKKLSVAMLAPWKWAKMRRKIKSNSDSKTEDEDSDSRSDSMLKKELSSSTGNLDVNNGQSYYPLRKSTSMPIQDDKSDESQFVPLSKDYSFKTTNRSATASRQQHDRSNVNHDSHQQSVQNSTGTVSQQAMKKDNNRRVSHDDDYLEPSEVSKIIAINKGTLEPERPNKSRLKRRTARRSKALGPQSVIYSKYRSGQLADSDESKEDVKENPPSQPAQAPRSPKENRRNSSNRNFVVLSFIDGGASIKQDSSFFSNFHKPMHLVSPMPVRQGEDTCSATMQEMADKQFENVSLSILPPSIPTELVYNVNTRESISETLPSAIFQESNLDLYSTGIAKMQLSTMKELEEKWKKATIPSLVKSAARDSRFYDNLQWSDLLLVADINNNIPCLITPHGCYFSVKIGSRKGPNINHMCSVKIEPNQHHVSHFAEKLLVKHDIRVSTTLQYHPYVTTTLAHFKEKLPLAMHNLIRKSVTNINLNNPVSCLLLNCSPICTLKQYVDNCVKYHEMHPLEYEYTIAMITLQLCYGLHYLHSVNVVHRDLSLDNLLLVKSQDDLYAPLELSITNFSYALHQIGIDNPFKISINTALANIGGNIEHLPPEIINVHETSTELNYQYCDPFAAGCIIFEMLHLDNPFADHTTQLAMQEYNVSDLPLIPIRSALSQSMERIAFALLNRIPEQRLTIQRAIRLLGFTLWGPKALKGNHSPSKTHDGVSNWLIAKRQEFLCYLVNKTTTTFLDDSIEISSFASVYTLEENLKLRFLTSATPDSLLEDWNFLTAPV